MTRTEELLALAEMATPGPWETNKADAISDSIEVTTPHGWISIADASPYDALFIAAANPETIKQLVELVVLQNEALKEIHGHIEYNWPEDEVGGHSCCYSLSYRPHDQDCAVNNAIAAFNKFEGGK